MKGTDVRHLALSPERQTPTRTVMTREIPGILMNDPLDIKISTIRQELEVDLKTDDTISVSSIASKTIFRITDKATIVDDRTTTLGKDKTMTAAPLKQ